MQETGDVFFSLVNLARHLDVDPEEALNRTNKKFMERFKAMEAVIQKEGKNLSDMTLQEMDTYWEAEKLKSK